MSPGSIDKVYNFPNKNKRQYQPYSADIDAYYVVAKFLFNHNINNLTWNNDDLNDLLAISKFQHIFII